MGYRHGRSSVLLSAPSVFPAQPSVCCRQQIVNIDSKIRIQSRFIIHENIDGRHDYTYYPQINTGFVLQPKINQTDASTGYLQIIIHHLFFSLLKNRHHAPATSLNGKITLFDRRKQTSSSKPDKPIGFSRLHKGQNPPFSFPLSKFLRIFVR